MLAFRSFVLLWCPTFFGFGEAVKYTLHTTCYTDAIGNPDLENARQLTNVIHEVVRWASRGAKVLELVADGDPKGARVKKVVEAFLDPHNLRVDARNAIRHFRSIANLQGPVGVDGPDGRKYDKSPQWILLQKQKDLFQHVLILCQQPLVQIPNDPSNLWNYIFDDVEDTTSRAAVMWREQRTRDTWKALFKQNPAITFAETSSYTPWPPTGDLRKLPNTIVVHAKFLEYLKRRDPPYFEWTEDILEQVTAPDAVKYFELRGRLTNFDLRPVDALYETSLRSKFFHEFLHVPSMGGLKDVPDGEEYGFANNVKHKSDQNADRFALMATNIELREKYNHAVDIRGAVTNCTSEHGRNLAICN